jgi:hypothetical protein
MRRVRQVSGLQFIPAWLLALALSANAVRAQEIAKPLGKWERKIGKNHVALIVEENRLHMISAGETVATLHADYSMTHDGVIYGVVTSIECDDDDNGESTKEMFDAPFSFRFRLDEGALIIHDAKGRDTGKDEFYNGRFKAIPSTPPNTTIVPTTSIGRTPSYALPNPPSSSAPLPSPPTPIGYSFSSPREGEKGSNETPKYTEQVFRFWTYTPTSMYSSDTSMPVPRPIGSGGYNGRGY